MTGDGRDRELTSIQLTEAWGSREKPARRAGGVGKQQRWRGEGQQQTARMQAPETPACIRQAGNKGKYRLWSRRVRAETTGGGGVFSEVIPDRCTRIRPKSGNFYTAHDAALQSFPPRAPIASPTGPPEVQAIQLHALREGVLPLPHLLSRALNETWRNQDRARQ